MKLSEHGKMIAEAYPSATRMQRADIARENLASEVNERDDFIAGLSWWLDKDAPAEEVLKHVRAVMKRAPERKRYES